jgi:hypothetical protein
MRRALASLLLVLFSFPLIAPAFTPSADAQLPACCRRDGKHHCSMAAGDLEQNGPVFQAIRPQCPCFPSGTPSSIPDQRSNAILGSAPSVFVSFHSDSVVQRSTEAFPPSALSRAHQKRGPPSLIS